ncbi:MAG: hypothetical protein PHH84_04460 [Oscillospiraceae bacterium]|nr:hypothetical protein [Oscillospiraceae bacterium]MDD4414895.1 hypothetical protein [Oscillospiraceae bacterium]
MITDDGDMKIAGDDFVQAQESDDSEATAKLLNEEKANGNLSRARRLGAILAEDVAAVEGDCPADVTQYMTQKRILMAFAVEVGLETYLPNSLLSQTAQNIFYETMRNTAPAFFEDLQGSGAFSFYFLCVRDGRNVERCVGETFATLCSRPGDKKLSKQGEDLYIHCNEQVKSFAQSMEFVR